MAKLDFTFVDEQGTDLNKFKVTLEDGTSYNIHLSRGATITTPGTPLNAENMNKLISAINEMYTNNVTGVKGSNESIYRTGNVNITKANIGLGNVNNTADSEKNVKSAITLSDYSIGSFEQPTYFENGIPVACSSKFNKIVTGVGFYDSEVKILAQGSSIIGYYFNTFHKAPNFYPKPYFLIFEVTNTRGEKNTAICAYDTFEKSTSNNPIAFSFSTADTKRVLLIYKFSDYSGIDLGRQGVPFKVKEMSGIEGIDNVKQIYLPYIGN